MSGFSQGYPLSDKPPDYGVEQHPPPAYGRIYGPVAGQPGPSQQGYIAYGQQQSHNAGPYYPPPPPEHEQAQQAWGYPQPQPMMYVYPPPGAYPPSPQQQQQQQVVIINSAGVARAPVMYESYCGHIVMSCFVFWCCNWLFGFIAFILAVVANNTVVSDPHGARSLGKASYGMSIAGIIITVIVVVVVVSVVVRSGCSYTKNYTCYRYRYYDSTSYYCTAYYHGYYTDRYCYYN